MLFIVENQWILHNANHKIGCNNILANNTVLEFPDEERHSTYSNMHIMIISMKLPLGKYWKP